MSRRINRWTRWMILLGSSGWLFQAGCARAFAREFEVLFAADASPTLIRQSVLVDVFGPAILRLFNT